MIKYILITISFFFFNSCKSQHLECGDLLEKYGEKPQHLDFISCKEGKGQTILVAEYKVEGKYSEEVEEFLIEKYNIGKLEFVCCGWEPSGGKRGNITPPELIAIDPYYILEISMFGNAEKEDENGKVQLEFDRTKIDFVVMVRIIRV
ncbi:DUF4952 domain-containing protein [Aquimarina algicola]|uniref:DUF4952 domain-containing protein n=1 Tax=Aquimarina algicola TaxID=2589995 RepID=A0A504JCZ2_9FLAO|nr:DUF4952 domain-containing protein [Aquimarina algicola]TPN88876.1 DUF4952 domain-containing protein [Aquimarina algicola]